jgi:hypothetical protein
LVKCKQCKRRATNDAVLGLRRKHMKCSFNGPPLK